MVTYIFAKQYAHDTRGVENPNEWVYVNIDGVWTATHLLVDCLIERPMYRTDDKYLKGMKGIFYKDKLICRNYDNPKIPKAYEHLPFIKLDYHDIDWKLAGYNV